MVAEIPVAETHVVVVPPERLPELALLGQQFQQEGALPGKFIPDVFVKTWTNLLHMDVGVLFGLEKDNRLVGGLGAIRFPDPNDGELVANELFWFVSKEHRGHGLKLLDVFESWAADFGIKRVSMVHLENLSPKALNRLYRSRGYRVVETHYFKEL
jgi:GNAT superfamily N-acetyltransferase